MKRLLIPLLLSLALPTAINANIFGGNFVIENFDKKYTVKKKGIREDLFYYLPDMLIFYLWHDVLPSEKPKLLVTKNERKNIISKYWQIWSNSDHAKIHLKVFEFRTVIKDLKSYKTDSYYKKLVCFNPSLNAVQRKEWKRMMKSHLPRDEYNSFFYVSQSSKTALDALNIKICNSVKFDDLQDRKTNYKNLTESKARNKFRKILSTWEID